MSGDHFVLLTATPWDDRTEIIGVYASAGWAREAAATWLRAPDREAFPRCVVESWNGPNLVERSVIEGIDPEDPDTRID